VVTQQVQDLSAVSITHKTMGIGLPRLRRGAAGLSLFRSCRIAQRGYSSLLPLYIVGRDVRLSGVFESAKKTERRPNDERFGRSVEQESQKEIQECPSLSTVGLDKLTARLCMPSPTSRQPCVPNRLTQNIRCGSNLLCRKHFWKIGMGLA
jgi:hypothetical protein